MRKSGLMMGAFLAWCGALWGAAPDRNAPFPVKLELEWVEQAESAGYYVALDQQFYRAENLDMTLLHAGTSREALQDLLDGRVDFAIGSLGRAFEHCAAGDQLVNIAQIQRHTGLLLVAPKKSGIKTLKDLEGRRIGMHPNNTVSVPARELLRREKINYIELPLTKGIDIFLYGGVDAMTALRSNEYFQILAAGINEDELTVFPISDLLNLPEGGIYTTRKFFQKHPEICAKVVRATQRGWRAAFRNPTAALQSVEKRCRALKAPYSPTAQKWMLDQIRRLIEPPNGSAGTLEPRLAFETFAIAHQLFRENGLKREIRYEEFAPVLPDSSAAQSEERQ